MEFTIDAVANKMILIIIGLSVLVMVGGVIFFQLHPAFYFNGAFPFAVGAAMAMGVNIVKVIWLKKTINKTVDIDAPQHAKLFFSLQYFFRIIFTGVVLLIAALAPDNIVNLLGVIIGILTFPVAMRLMQFFIPADTAIISKVDDADSTGKED
ncbi:MAG: hypothetical protein FWC32_05620 [Firmicutes bacterium]|nr:hypothetical protein [Bacillota bacterium]